MLTLNVTNRIIMKITVRLIPTRQRFDNCLLKKFNYTYHYLGASLFFIIVKITETITSTKLAQHGTHENSFSQQNVDQQNSKQKRLCC
jgi:hypothetical protein